MLALGGTNVNPVNDEITIILMIRAGNPDALVLLSKRFTTLLERILKRIYPWMYCEDIEDIIVDTFLHIVERRNYDPERASLQTWVVNRALFEAKTFHKKRGKFINEGLPNDNTPVWTRGRSGFEQIRPIDTSEPSPEIRAALQQLSRTHQQLILQHYYEGRPLSEIARLRGCKEETVESQVCRARRILAKILGSRVTIESQEA